MTKKFDTLYRDGGIDRLRRIFPDDAEASVERPLWDSIAQEPARLSGASFRLYSLRRAKNLHPLYREPTAGGKDWENVVALCRGHHMAMPRYGSLGRSSRTLVARIRSSAT